MLQSPEMSLLKLTTQVSFTTGLDPTEFCIISPPIQHSNTSTRGASTPATPALPVYDYSAPLDPNVCAAELRFLGHHLQTLKQPEMKLELDITTNILVDASTCALKAYSPQASASWPT